MRWAALVLLLATASCPAPPADGAQACDADPAHPCPEGQRCVDGRCYSAGHVFDLAVSEPDPQPDLTAPPDLVLPVLDLADGWHAEPMSNGSWDWDGDGITEYEYPLGNSMPPPVTFACLSTGEAACPGRHWVTDAPNGTCGKPMAVILCAWDRDSRACGTAGSEPTVILRCR